MTQSTVGAILGLHMGLLGVILAAGIPTVYTGSPGGLGIGIIACILGLEFLLVAWFDAKHGY